MKQLREIVVDENLQILGGHQRIYALKDLGYQDVVVKQVFGLKDKQKREFMIKDNTAAGAWDTDILANQFDISELKEWGVPDFGSLGGDDEKKEKPTGGDRQMCCPACGYEGEASEFNPNAQN
jgi:ParB-like chromosome segregation protein Spo0J